MEMFIEILRFLYTKENKSCEISKSRGAVTDFN